MQYSLLTDEVQAILGSTAGTGLVSNTRAGIWLNEAQRQISRKYPGLRNVRTFEKDKLWVTAAAYEVALSLLTNTCQRILRLWWYDRTLNNYWLIKPFVGGIDRWDELVLPLVLWTSHTGLPDFYARRGNTIELNRRIQAADSVLHDTGADATNVDPSVITAAVAGTYADLTLDGKYAYVTGTNVTSAYYEIDENDDDTITLLANCCTGATSSDVTVDIGAVLWCEYGQMHTAMSADADTPTLNGVPGTSDDLSMDMALTYLAAGIGLKSPILNNPSGGAVLEAQGWMHARDVVEGEQDGQMSTMNPYQGP